MRCLYCGKELALLKRWTGGGEFCSDAHRQQYQEEYSQLALNRLLQAKPQEAAKPLSRPEPAPAPVPAARENHPMQPAASKAPAPIPQAPPPKPELPAVEANPVAPQPPAEEPAPAVPAGFLIELPVPVTVEVCAIAGEEGGFDQALPPQLPSRVPEPFETDLVLAGRFELRPCGRVMDCAARPVERRVEVREFVRAAPLAGFDTSFDLSPAGETGLVRTCEESMDILFFPHPPQASPPLWQEEAASFSLAYEIGALARVPFGTTGVDDSGDGAGLMPVEPVEEKVAAVAPAAVAKPPAPAAVSPDPAPRPSAPPAPVISVRVPPSVASKTAVADRAEQPAAPSAQKASDPELVTKPLPLTLHGLAAGRGKPHQVFPNAVAGNLEIQAPRSTALPLRPAMTLGPAPAKTEERKPAPAVKTESKTEPKTEPKPEPRKPQPVRSDPRPANGKPSKPEIAKPEPARQPIPASAAESVEPGKIESATSNPEPKPADPVDLGLPKLTIEPAGMPTSRRIAIAAGAVVFVAGVAFFALRGGSSTVVAKGPQVVTGAPLPAVDSGWITDWGAEPGVRREHDISVLRPSLNLSDYRIEFQAQIENKALGWVFRARDGKNYYVGKLEIVTPGLEPIIAVVHYPVLNGEAQQRSQVPLPMKVRLDTVYKIRFDALGDHFTTWVQDQKVDDWTDDRLKAGGVGLFNDRGERMSLDGGVSVLPLVIKR